MSERYFVDTGDGVSYFTTADEARTAASEAVEGWRPFGDPEWPEEVEGVCWGRVLGTTQAVPVGANDEFVDFILVDLP